MDIYNCLYMFLQLSWPFTDALQTCCALKSSLTSLIFLSQVKALTLFVTHYPPLCELERVYPKHVSNYHMAFLLNDPEITTDTDGECVCLLVCAHTKMQSVLF